MFMTYGGPDNRARLYGVIYFASVITVACIIAFFIYSNRLKHQNDVHIETEGLYGESLGLKLAYGEQVHDDYEKVRQFRHDFRHHIAAMEGLVYGGEYSELEKYMGQLSQKDKELNQERIRYTGNFMVDSIIFGITREQKFEKVRFTRVDSDVIDNLIVKEDKKNDVLDAGKQEALSAIFKSQLPQIEKTEFSIMAQSLGENASPVMITQSEYMRRMKEMANIQAGMSFYGEMPDMFNLVLNADHKLVKEILDDEDRECTAAIAPVQKEMDDINNRRNELKKKQEGKKDEEISTVEKDEVDSLDKKWEELKAQKESLFADYAAHNKVVRQLIDLALLQNGMLKGEALNNFVKRSIDMIK